MNDLKNKNQVNLSSDWFYVFTLKTNLKLELPPKLFQGFGLKLWI